MSNVIPFPTQPHPPGSRGFLPGTPDDLLDLIDEALFSEPKILTPSFAPEVDNVSLFFNGLVECVSSLSQKRRLEASTAKPTLAIVAPSDPLDRLTLSLEECLSIIPPGRTLGDFDD